MSDGCPASWHYLSVYERADTRCGKLCAFLDGYLSGSPLQLWSEASKVGSRSLVVDLGAQVIPIDGKTLKGSDDRNQEQSSLHVVSAWASEYRLFLGQVQVDDQSNEITAIPALLELLDISGCIITIDAMGTRA